MVTLIGGFSCSGKTLLADRLMKDLDVPYFSIDYLKMGIFRSDKDCGFTPTDHDNHIADKLWPIIREMIYTYIENGRDVILEGCYLMPEHITQIDDVYKDKVQLHMIGFSEQYIINNFTDKILANKGVIEKRTADDERPIENFIKGHAYLKDKANKHKIPYHMIEKDYVSEFEEIIKDIKEGSYEA
ncbi:ATP-binding protein [Acidaminobacter sp. JC074]|uniref:AAA family ATPase n=1 Tax=Acidaminobacter sp. JC074 TaxID=2530199 RepID=UPI001F115ADF|nr:AAA family ATPase [Acidaminobacter sp. JC074]MCH4889642.1 ATP-binding protein [Acidaminobacter sp. JC074]